MKRIAFLIFLFVLSGCATTQKYYAQYAQKYHFEIVGYNRPLPSYDLKLAVYYYTKVEGNQLVEKESAQFGTKKTGSFTVATGFITFKKFSSAFTSMFEKVERSLMPDRSARLLETKTNHIDLICEVKLLNYLFTSEAREGAAEKYKKDVYDPPGIFNPLGLGILNPFVMLGVHQRQLNTEMKQSVKTNFGIWVSFYKPDGSVITENTYPYATAEPVYLSTYTQPGVLYKTSNRQFSKGVDEIISRAIADLRNSEKFKELVDSKKPSTENPIAIENKPKNKWGKK